jgi:hypothetical protein
VVQAAILMCVVTMNHVSVASNVEVQLRCMALCIACGLIK